VKDPTLGTLVMRAPMAHHTLHCVQFAHDRNHSVLVASVAGPQTAVKSFAAALNENVKLTINCDDFEIIDSDGEQLAIRKAVDFSRVGGGQGRYKCHMHRLGYNQVHCLAVVKDPWLMPCVTEESLWQKLRSPLYTTPLLREWMPWLMQNLISDSLLVKLPAFQCNPGMLTVDDTGLDALVSRGVGTGALKIPDRKECA
jgi:hypothetical protein